MVEFTPDAIRALFGAEDAENESSERLRQYFYRNRAYDSLRSNVPIRIVVGHKGVGKSAILKMAYLEDMDASHPSIWLQPSDLSTLDGTYDPRFDKATLAWQQGLLSVIYNKIEDLIAGHRSDDSGNILFSTSKDLVSAVLSLAKKHADLNLDHTRAAILDKFQSGKTIHVYLDDLDRGWQGRRGDIMRLSALLNSLRDICGEYVGVQFRLGLRSDVYYLIRTSDESTDKIEQYVVPLSWTNHDILVLMAKRIATYFGEKADDEYLAGLPQKEIATRFHKIIEPVFHYEGKWKNAPIHVVLLSLTRRRPRDLVKLFSGAAHRAFANRHDVITTEDLRSTFSTYSQERLQDIINEFKSELPNVKELLIGMKPLSRKKGDTGKAFLYTNDSLSTKLLNVKSSTSLIFTNGEHVNFHSMKQFLFKTDFIIARNEKPDGKPEWIFFDDNRFAASTSEFGYHWEVHPAYRWALERRSVQEVIDETDLVAQLT